jgi:hypothetical protein
MNKYPFLKIITTFFLIFFLGFIMNQNKPAEWLEVIGGYGMFLFACIGLTEWLKENR